MSRWKRLSFLLLAFAASMCGARVAHACSCAGTPTVLEEYEQSEVIVIVRVISLAEPAPGAEKTDRPVLVGSARVVVEKVYKGKLKAGDELTFAQSSNGSADCVWTFGERSIGRKFLFYVGEPKKSSVWVAIICGRSNSVEGAGDDLLYLNRLDKVRGRTRISGTVSFADEDAPSAVGLTVRITGASKTHVVKTDENGVYEIYDLPAGKYYVDVETPPGWKNGGYGVGYLRSLIQDLPLADGQEKKKPEGIPIVLEDKKHAGLDIRFEIDNAIRGKVFDPTGRPMKDVCLKLLPAEGKAPEHFYGGTCTDEGGAFEIDEIPTGSYVLVVNDDGKLSSDEPFGAFYYPKVFKREEATVFQIGRGDFVENVHVYAPRVEETITVEGVLLYSDGKPVADKWVEFKPEKAGGDGDESEARALTDARGRFSVKILKGKRGELFGEMSTYAGEFENCPRLESIIKQSGNRFVDLSTPAVEIRAEENLHGVELRYPFPGCQKAK